MFVVYWFFKVILRLLLLLLLVLLVHKQVSKQLRVIVILGSLNYRLHHVSPRRRFRIGKVSNRHFLNVFDVTVLVRLRWIHDIEYFKRVVKLALKIAVDLWRRIRVYFVCDCQVSRGQSWVWFPTAELWLLNWVENALIGLLSTRLSRHHHIWF